jgi:hypothetical protein
MKTTTAISLLIGVGWFGSLLSSPAATYYVDAAKGDDKNQGDADAPFKTTKPAIKKAQPGDLIRMAHVDFPIHEAIEIINRSGAEGNPITLDANGNLFTGADPIKPEDWTEIKPGLFRNEHLLPWLKKPAMVDGKLTPDGSTAATLQRYFLVWNSEMNRMGRSSKGDRRTPLPAPDALQPGQWTYVADETAFYIAVTPGTKLSDYRIDAPTRMNGVSVGGTCAHWIIRNVNTTHVINDGFNIQGHTHDFTYENITSTECGDDGFSQHAGPNEESECVIRNFVSRLNSTGIANLGSGTYESVVLEDNYGENLLLMGAGVHDFHHCVISAQAPAGGWGGIALDGTAPAGKMAAGAPTARFTDCKIPWPTTPNPSGRPAITLSNPDCHVEILGTTKLDGAINQK